MMRTPLAEKLNKIVDAYRAQLPVDVGGVPFFIQSMEHSDDEWGGAIRLTVVTKFTKKEVGE